MDRAKILSELSFRTSRSSGAGGQHVNKVESKVELYFSVPNSAGLEVREKEILLDKWASRLSKDGTLRMECQATRSQADNKERVIGKFFNKLKKDLTPPRKRIATKPGKKQKELRLEQKKRQSEKKSGRARVDLSKLTAD